MNHEVKKLKSDVIDTVESHTSETSSIDKRSPRKLSTLCICYVAANLHLVESLLYFPDVVGVEIFNEALKLREFKGRDKECLLKLKLFCEAYENLMLISLSLPGSHLCLNNYFEHLSLFEHLEELDVSSNGLGDDHDVLHHISHLKWLRTLCLRNNCLSNDGLRKLTSPLRMLHQGPLDLHNLDLTENPEISSKGVKYLKCFQNLQILILSSYISTQLAIA
ncbi:leucine-rich repeat-containing protein 42 [Patella vulgata]|uniref:leucine-rich repeat-containing protein 42 n=1 Tax=Patella vulgata TaxID=6465 RepID=UPI0024A7AD6A|nr:leucine-rich repeat-containing protein 42 [Patella vulgata]